MTTLVDYSLSPTKTVADIPCSFVTPTSIDFFLFVIIIIIEVKVNPEMLRRETRKLPYHALQSLQA